MINLLEDLLHEKTKGSQSEILFAQWSYDKKIIPTALQSVSNLFPHYSLHDESHSITIINNIIRLTGIENINKLSAIDIWLLLEAAYCHDLGMVVSSEKITGALDSKEFIEFFKQILYTPKNSLHEFANKFKVNNNKTIELKDSNFSLDLIDGIKYILAEYFRKIHAERSKTIITDPHKELSLLSPRGAIPQRIFKILGEICSAHTKDFNSVLELPFSEVGIDIENAHPRYIACLLRIGDLLDLDNNRFSEVMLRTLSKIPIDTLNHKSKHLAIESFRADREIIEVTAKCANYDTASITQHWFNYLNKEISSQMINWNVIVPNKDMGYLPTIGNLKVELTDYDLIDGKNKPKFTVDTDKALELLQGTGLYDGAHQCIREILQNAVDATLIRIWLEHGHEKNFSDPNNSDFNNLLKSYPISVNIIKKHVDETYQYWQVEIKDFGTGISSYDLKFLMNTGSSSKNIKKTSIIDDMPLWMRPSGTFGIGFQSIFMITDSVVIKTKSFFDEKSLIIELNSPNSLKDGDILIQKKQTTHFTKPGSLVTFTYKALKIPDRYSIKSEHNYTQTVSDNYDPFSNESLDIEISQILDEVITFSQKSYFTINILNNGTELSTIAENQKKFEYYDEEYSLELNVKSYLPNYGSRIKTYYKNQIVENSLSIYFINLEVNIHKDKASKVLTLNRNKIKDEYYQTLEEQIFTSVYKVLTNNFDNICTTSDERIFGSMFLHYYQYSYGLVKHYDIEKFTDWGEYKIVQKNNNSTSIKRILSTIDTLVIKRSKNNNHFPIREDIYELNNKTLTITLHDNRHSSVITKFLVDKCCKKLAHSKYVFRDKGSFEKIVLSENGSGYPISKKQLKKSIQNIKYSFTARAFIPCISEYKKLRVKDDAYKGYVTPIDIYSYIAPPLPKMLCPYILQRGKNSVLKSPQKKLNTNIYEWVYNNRYYSQTSKEEIIETYEKFCKDFGANDII